MVRSHKSVLGVHPVCSRTHIHEQWHREARRVLHLILYEQGHSLYFAEGHLEHEFIVHL